MKPNAEINGLEQRNLICGTTIARSLDAKLKTKLLPKLQSQNIFTLASRVPTHQNIYQRKITFALLVKV